jgi:hypothetical protein
MRVNRALDKLRGLLARRGIASTATALSLALTNHAVVAAPAGLASAVTGASLAVAPVGASAAAASVLSFMSTTKATLGIAVIAMIAALGTATYEIRESRAAEATLATARRDYDALVAKRRDLAQQTQAAEQDAARLRQAMADARAAQAAADTSQAAKAAAAWDPVAEGKVFLSRHPEVKQALIASKIAEMDFRYGALYKSLGLTPAQIAQFQMIMLASGSGGWVNRLLVPELKEMVFSIVDTDLAQNGTRRLRELLGDDGYRQFTEFNRVDSARQLAVQVASFLYFTEAPMTPAQSEQLIQILDNNRSPRSGPQVSPFDWDAVLAQARDVLSVPQLAAVNGLRVSAQHNQAMAGGNVLPIAPAPTSALKLANPPSP